ncbi:unnamed protein product [Coffea canephora]|uniref:Uncharacterized protein n=1 Tax=Coffea canephora TaxID=49390 RepID=A0A068UV46_COFCA|nr:unnamed protein product [Coffea canephora]
MGEKSKKPRKNFVTEEDFSTLLQRYTATTVLTLLQEVAQVQDSKIDWNVLVKKSKTGISNPREYQMLWRHLAYRDALLDRLDDAAAQPLDDDSDLECDLEAFPAVSNEALAEAAACVKVLIASGPSDPNGLTVEAPLTINIPKGQPSRAPENSHCNVFAQGTNITVPVSVQKPSLPSVASAEALDSNGAANANLPRRKRKAWTDVEDQELMAAVRKFGEGNWANILKGDFKSDRTASQLSQRWAIIKKRKGNVTLGTGSQLSEVQLAARRAVSLALNMPMGDTLKSSPSISSGTNTNVAHSKLGPPHSNETPSIVAPLQHDSVSTAGHQIGSSKSRVTTKKPSTKSTISPDSMVKAAAVAAGARIATPSDAATLLKAAQSKNAVHIMPGGSVLKSSMAGNANSLPSNVHFIRTGLASKPLSTYSTAAVSSSQNGGTQQVLGTSSKPAIPLNQPNSAGTAQELSAPSEVTSVAVPGPVSRLESKIVEDFGTFMCNSEKDLLKENQAGFKCDGSNEQMKGDLTAVSVDTKPNQVQEDQGASENLCSDQAEGGQASVMGEILKEHASGDEVSASANALNKKAGDLIDSQSSSMAASNGHLSPTDNQASTTFDSISKDDVMGMPVKCISDKPVKEMFENNMAKREEGLIMDLDGNDGQANLKQREAFRMGRSEK